MLAALLGPTSRCVDGGAHTGTITQHLVRFAPLGQHIAVEPIPELARRLTDMYPTVDVRRVALGARNGRAEFNHVTGAPYLSGMWTDEHSALPREVITVEVTTIDDLVGNGTVDFLKLDLEGQELQALRGGMTVLRASMPVVAFEHTRVVFGEDMTPSLGKADYGTTESIHSLLHTELGYRIYDLDGNGPLAVDEFLRLYETAERFNFLARI